MVDEILRSTQSLFLSAECCEDHGIMPLPLTPDSRQFNNTCCTRSIIICPRYFPSRRINMAADNNSGIRLASKYAHCRAAIGVKRFGLCKFHHVGRIGTKAFKLFSHPIQCNTLILRSHRSCPDSDS